MCTRRGRTKGGEGLYREGHERKKESRHSAIAKRSRPRNRPPPTFMTAHIFPENEAFIFDQRGHLVSVSRSKFGSKWPSVSTRKRTRKKRRLVGRFISRRQLPVRRSTCTERSGEPFIASVSQNSVFPFPRLGQCKIRTGCGESASMVRLSECLTHAQYCEMNNMPGAFAGIVATQSGCMHTRNNNCITPSGRLLNEIKINASVQGLDQRRGCTP